MEEPLDEKIRAVRFYLNSLPATLPIASPDAAVNALLSFSLDPEWVEDIGEEGAVNRALEVALFDFLPRSDAGIFRITTRGSAISMLAHILETWIEKYPTSVILQKWLQNALDSAKDCFAKCNVPLPPFQTNGINEPTPVNGPNPKAAAAKKTLKIVKKPDTKILASTDDANYVDLEEVKDNRNGGKKMSPVLLSTSRLCRKVEDDGKKIVRCIGSAGCHTTWCYPRDQNRVLRHVMGCGYVAMMDGGGQLVQNAIEALAAKDPTLLAELTKRIGEKRKVVVDEEQQPKPKRKKMDLSHVFDTSMETSAQEDGASITPETVVNGDKLVVFKTEGRRILEQEGNRALVEFIVCCGLAPNILATASFKRFIESLKTRYTLPSRTKFEDSLVPTYAAAVRVSIITHLQKCRNLNISFDGGKLTKKKFYSVHVTTPHHQSFCLELDNVSRLSQTSEYLQELLKKWIVKIGPFRFCGIASDDAGNTNKGRRLICQEFPHILDMPDACHNLHNTCKDICNLEEFKPSSTQLRELLSFMAMSTYTLDFFDLARDELKIGRGLQSVGDTRFATIYWSLESVLNGFPAFEKIARERHLNGIDSQIIHKIFDDTDSAYTFRRELTLIGSVIMPIARAIQCLESKEINAADVYLYWLAVVAQIHDLFTRDNKLAAPKYGLSLKEKIRAIINYRFGQLIFNERAQNIYLIAFTLDAFNRGAAVLSAPNPLAIPALTISISKGGTPAIKPPPQASEGIRIGLQRLLEKEYRNQYRPGCTIEEAQRAMMKVHPHLASRLPTDALAALKEQFSAYMAGDSPFNRVRRVNQSQREWWEPLLKNRDSDVLAALAVKIFSAVPTSIVDERAMSVVTWLNSPKRNRQSVDTISNHLAIRNFAQLQDVTLYSRKPLTVNWRDMKKTIFGNPIRMSNEKSLPILEQLDTTLGESAIATTEPEEGIDWLDEGVPDLSHVSHHHFNLAKEFDISRYLDILADEVNSEGPVRRSTASVSSASISMQGNGVDRSHDASTVAPLASAWAT